MSTPTAGWPVNTLVASLSRSGWGDLAPRPFQGARDVLAALANLLPHRSAEGRVTVAQIADAAGRSPKWTAHCLRVLEDLGVIQARRGGIRHGRPEPGWVRISKSALVRMIAAARAELTERRARRAEATAARIAAYGLQNTIRRRRPLSSHMELSSPLPPPTGGVVRAGAHRRPAAEIQTAETNTTRTGDAHMIAGRPECIHGNPNANTCGMCRRALRLDPTMDVRDLWAAEAAPLPPATVAARIREIRDAIRAGRGLPYAPPVQPTLEGEE